LQLQRFFLLVAQEVTQKPDIPPQSLLRQPLFRVNIAGFGMDSFWFESSVWQLNLEVKHQPRPIAGGNGEKMSLGLLGRKVGMMRIFTDDGDSIPVTVLDVSNNRVAQIKTPETDGYTAVQVVYGARRASRVNKAAAGHYAKAGVEAGTSLKEFRIDAAKAAELKAGDVIAATMFEAGQKVDVQGTSIGKGYAGTIKRYNFRSGRATHGNSRSHNVPGSIGMAQDPGRVFPGKRMTGHMGDVTVSVQNLEIARVDAERSLLMVKGAVPGAKNGAVVVKPAIKVKAKKGA
jgi:large subunit ribosomal protein L3